MRWRRFALMWGYGLDIDYDIRELVAMRVKALRKARGESSRALSRQLGYGHGFISEIERLQREMSYHALWKVAEHFNTSIDALVGPPRTLAEHQWMIQKVAARAAVSGRPGQPASGRRSRSTDE